MSTISTATFAVETSALDAGDVVANAIIQFPIAGIYSGSIEALTILDPDHNTAANIAGELWLFHTSVSAAAADAAHSVSDADMAYFLGVIPIAAGDCYLNALNTVAVVRLAAPLPFIAPAAILYAIYRVTATPTFAGGTLTMRLAVR